MSGVMTWHRGHCCARGIPFSFLRGIFTGTLKVKWKSVTLLLNYQYFQKKKFTWITLLYFLFYIRLENHSSSTSCTLFWAIVRPLNTVPTPEASSQSPTQCTSWKHFVLIILSFFFYGNKFFVCRLLYEKEVLNDDVIFFCFHRF